VARIICTSPQYTLTTARSTDNLQFLFSLVKSDMDNFTLPLVRPLVFRFLCPYAIQIIVRKYLKFVFSPLQLRRHFLCRNKISRVWKGGIPPPPSTPQVTPMHTTVGVYLHSFLTSALDETNCSASLSGLLYPQRPTGAHSTRRWIAPRVSLEILKKNKRRDSSEIRTILSIL
jgi:hypothetical protein